MKKGFLIAAILLVVVGIGLLAYVLFSTPDLSKVSPVKYETVTYAVEGNFTKIEVDTQATDIIFKPSQDGTASVVCEELENVRHSVLVENATLKISIDDTREWFQRVSFFSRDRAMIVYLPSDAYEAISITNSTGDVRIPALALGELNIKVSTGDIELSTTTAEEIRLTSSTGNIFAGSVTCKGTLSIKVSTGSILLSSVSCKTLESTGSTGNMKLLNVLATDAFVLERSTGDIRFEACDANEISIKTSTGDVLGTLRSEKIFTAKSSTGFVKVPNTTSGGVCKITTSTGDIEIKIEE